VEPRVGLEAVATYGIEPEGSKSSPIVITTDKLSMDIHFFFVGLMRFASNGLSYQSVISSLLSQFLPLTCLVTISRIITHLKQRSLIFLGRSLYEPPVVSSPLPPLHLLKSAPSWTAFKDALGHGKEAITWSCRCGAHLSRGMKTSLFSLSRSFIPKKEHTHVKQKPNCR
jgi:hypothetical protein